MAASETDRPEYRIERRQIGETERFRLHRATLPDGGNGIAVVAKGIEHNGSLERFAFVLDQLRERAAFLEAEYAKVKDDPNSFLNYRICFPDLVDSFVNDEDGLRIMIVRFHNVADDVGRLVPLSQLVGSGKRVDPKTSAWIVGKLLKVLAFAHDFGVSVGLVTADNVLIEPDEHYVVLFDWSYASFGEGGFALSGADEAKQAAAIAFDILGGNPDKGTLPEHEQLADDRYASFLKRLADGEILSASRAHEEFYELIRSLWPRQYHPFTIL